MEKLPWEDQFMQSVAAIAAGGETEERAKHLLQDYIRLARTTTSVSHHENLKFAD